MNTLSVFKDQMGNTVTLKDTPKRIVSIVPSQTELLADLGLDEEVVGITKYCIHPKGWHEHKTIVGGTKKLNLEKIRNLKPDLIIGNKEE
ncbi:MAG: cobalamin-binding protein, partial [Bacteroidetes bacterium]